LPGKTFAGCPRILVWRDPLDQLIRAVGSIGANIAEGYSRGSARDRARFYEYALGSAREARDWYWKVRHGLDEATLAARLSLMTQLVRLLLRMMLQQRHVANVKK
jgi:four helix bundle protein